MESPYNDSNNLLEAIKIAKSGRVAQQVTSELPVGDGMEVPDNYFANSAPPPPSPLSSGGVQANQNSGRVPPAVPSISQLDQDEVQAYLKQFSGNPTAGMPQTTETWGKPPKRSEIEEDIPEDDLPETPVKPLPPPAPKEPTPIPVTLEEGEEKSIPEANSPEETDIKDAPRPSKHSGEVAEMIKAVRWVSKKFEQDMLTKVRNISEFLNSEELKRLLATHPLRMTPEQMRQLGEVQLLVLGMFDFSNYENMSPAELEKFLNEREGSIFDYQHSNKERRNTQRDQRRKGKETKTRKTRNQSPPELETTEREPEVRESQTDRIGDVEGRQDSPVDERQDGN